MLEKLMEVCILEKQNAFNRSTIIAMDHCATLLAGKDKHAWIKILGLIMRLLYTLDI